MQERASDFARIHNQILASVDSIPGVEPKTPFDRLIQDTDGVRSEDLLDALRLPVDELIEVNWRLAGPAESRASIITLATRVVSDDRTVFGSEHVAVVAGSPWVR